MDMDMELIVEELTKEINKEHVLRNEKMSKHTTFKVGGSVDIFISPSNTKELTHAIKICKTFEIPYYVIGNGSNILVKDNGFRGVIIQIYKNFDNVTVDDETITAHAGVLLSKLSKIIADESLEGFEFASGIPGTLGGAVYMNAGAYGGDISKVIVSADVIDEQGNIVTLSKEQLELGYRTSIIQKNNYIILSAVLKCRKGNKEKIREVINDLNNRRKQKQPLEFPSAGSTFKRPEGYFAGKLIMDSGLKGYQIGNAQVSEKHCGFIINKGNATAEDIINLIGHVRKVVNDKYNVSLETEVRIIGE
ncbi:UDP-N-acetylenolpyruvoylglucosamine reductase [Vallitalea longa]|uniref:UDP-N-acetylenolpyruvoylglucosamine reductase n=1 Tax=Vallitalea longa TaxID=2936439 RepID=A0A9W5YDM8_9FIRM|nr:UDP-N-acetylmuramate dehydrogenase [Vallitalea longa]GKX30428.1 UDP-N-acetylenolpyruvoylglucosamine reductase [Vallitalea longa]